MLTGTGPRTALSAFVAVGELEVWIAGQPWREAPGGWAVPGERHPPQRSRTAPLLLLRSLRPGQHDPNRRRSLALGRGDTDATGDGLQPENPAFERRRDRPTTRRRFPGLLRDPGFHVADPDEGGQHGADFALGQAKTHSVTGYNLVYNEALSRCLSMEPAPHAPGAGRD